MGKIKRSQLAVFLDIGSADWALVGEGVTEQTINYGPQTSEETYVHQDSATTDIESYKVNIPTPMTAIKGDGVFEFVDNIRRNRKVLADAETEVCIVYLYDSPVSGAYPAEKSKCTIQVDDFGGAGGESTKINFTINLNGDPVQGTFNPATKAFNVGGVDSYMLTFRVTATTAPVAGATIVVDGQNLKTNSNGIANVVVPAGTYAYTAIADGLANKTGSVVISNAPKFEAVAMTA